MGSLLVFLQKGFLYQKERPLCSSFNSVFSVISSSSFSTSASAPSPPYSRSFGLRFFHLHLACHTFSIFFSLVSADFLGIIIIYLFLLNLFYLLLFFSILISLLLSSYFIHLFLASCPTIIYFLHEFCYPPHHLPMCLLLLLTSNFFCFHLSSFMSSSFLLFLPFFDSLKFYSILFNLSFYYFKFSLQ